MPQDQRKPLSSSPPSFPADDIVLAILQDRVALQEEFARTQTTISRIKQELSISDLSPQKMACLKQEVERANEHFRELTRLIQDHRP